jgi:AAA+ superfamily predicted ATPase
MALTQKRSVQLSDDLCVAAERRYQNVFGNIEQLLEAVLTELVRDEAAKLDEAEQQLVQQRLRELGYL